MKGLLRNCAFVGMLLVLSPSQAALITDVSFTERTGTVRADEIVEVWVTLTVDSLSDPLFIDNTASGPSFGLDPAIVPTTGQNTSLFDPLYNPDYEWWLEPFVPFTEWDSFYGGTNYAPCGENGFNAACGPGNYTSVPSSYRNEDRFRWYTRYNEDPSAGYPNESFLLNPGESMDFLALAFQPIDGLAGNGTFELYDAGLGLYFYGTDSNGDRHRNSYLFGRACESRTSDCVFTRTVVPVPAAVWLFGSGLGLLGWMSRKA